MDKIILPKFSQYNLVRESISKKLIKFNNVCGVYEYGTTTAEGISDLDFIIQTEDINFNKKINFKLNKLEKNLIGTGNIIIANLNTLKNIKYFDDINLKPIIQNKKITLNKLSDEEKYYQEITSIIDWAPERMTLLSNLLNEKKIDIIRILRVLYSLLYSLKKLKKFNNFYDHEIEEMIIYYRNKKIIKNLSDSNLDDLINNTLKFSIKSFSKFTDYYLDNSKDFFTKFPNDLKPININKFNSAHGKKLINIHPIFKYHFFVYSSFENEISKLIRKNLSVYKEYSSIHYNEKYYQILKKRLILMNKDLLNLNNFKLVNSKFSILRFGHLI